MNKAADSRPTRKSIPETNIQQDSTHQDQTMASPQHQAADSPAIPSPAEEEEEENADLPLPLSASVILEHLPKDASQALRTAGTLEQPKVIVRLSPLPNTPQLKQPRFTCSSNQRFEYIVNFVRRKLGLKANEGTVFCYVNSVFAPRLDEGVGNLWRVSIVDPSVFCDDSMLMGRSVSRSKTSLWSTIASRRRLDEDL